MCEYFCHPAKLLDKLPEGMSYEMGALAEPLTIALHGIHRGGLKAGEYVAILGAGPIGLYAGMAAEAYGAHAIIIDIVQERLDFAKQMGIEYTINSKEVNAVEKVMEITGEGAQLVMECSGANILIRQSLDMVCHAGRITFTGWPKQETSLPTDMITRKEIDIRGARTSAREFEEALELLNSGKVKLMDTVTKIDSHRGRSRHHHRQREEPRRLHQGHRQDRRLILFPYHCPRGLLISLGRPRCKSGEFGRKDES